VRRHRTSKNEAWKEAHEAEARAVKLQDRVTELEGALVLLVQKVEAVHVDGEDVDWSVPLRAALEILV